MIKFVSALWQVCGFFLGSPVFSTNKIDHNDITDILLKVAFNTITLTLTLQILALTLQQFYKTVYENVIAIFDFHQKVYTSNSILLYFKLEFLKMCMLAYYHVRIYISYGETIFKDVITFFDLRIFFINKNLEGR